MKRSSSDAALADPEPESKWNYQDDVLATSMMLVSIDEENVLKRNHQTSGSLCSMASSRCSSRGSLNGWGSSTSRKSYKVDLSSLAGDDCSPKDQQHRQHQGSRTAAPSSGSTSDHADVDDSWGFFVDSTF
mmetsp:Transcript_12900/g.20762  ORF Transcript_12900/g.20762 Transcript_12900/m.20762 type:complete len:131 (+) Transcript_12900:80-472(+)